jgi:hypothetical protein
MFSVGRSRRGLLSGRSVLSTRYRARREEKQKGGEKEKSLPLNESAHRHPLFYAAQKNFSEEAERQAPLSIETAPLQIDIVRKRQPHFAFFLLTRSPHEPILPLQIRGT